MRSSTPPLLAALLANFAVGAAAAVPQTSAPADPATLALEAAVDLPEPALRQKAVASLLARRDVDLSGWLERAEHFGRFEAAPPGVSAVTAPIWDGESVQELRFEVFVPDAYEPERPHPLLIVLHGAGGSPLGQSQPWIAVANALSMLIVAPADGGPNQGYAFSERERTTALSTLRWMRRHYDVDENRIHLTGVSRGGHFSWDLALRHPDLFASVAPMIGGPRLANSADHNNFRFLEGLVHTPLAILQGAQDDPGLVLNQRLAVERLENFGAERLQYHEFADLGHSFRLEVVDWKDFFGSAVRDPSPPQTVSLWGRSRPGRIRGVEVLRTDDRVADDFPLDVDARRWNAMDEEHRRRMVVQAGDEHTARVEVRRDEPGGLRLRTQRVRSLKLWLARADLPPDAVSQGRAVWSCQLDGRRVRREVAVSVQALLTDFVERFDRSFLPVATVEVTR